MRRRFIAYPRYHINYRYLLYIILFILGFILSMLLIFNNKTITESEAKSILSLSTNNLSILKEYNLTNPEALLTMTYNNSKTKDYPKEQEVIKESKEPLIYIYNTHQTEGYEPGFLKEYNITPTVYMAANILKKKLSNLNIESIVEDENIVNVLKEHNWKYSESYNASMLWLENIHNKYPSIKYYIDLHRDSHAGTIYINDKPYAKMMFVIGMNHDNYKKNESLMLSLNDYLKSHYENLMRDPFYGKRSRYNQHFNQNVILIEVGGPKNTIEEVQNSISALADAISNYLGETYGA